MVESTSKQVITWERPVTARNPHLHLLFVLLLCGDVKLNPGPINSNNSRNSFHIYYSNQQSIKNKLTYCAVHLSELIELDCFAVTESWLNDSVGDSELP